MAVLGSDLLLGLVRVCGRVQVVGLLVEFQDLGPGQLSRFQTLRRLEASAHLLGLRVVDQRLGGAPYCGWGLETLVARREEGGATHLVVVVVVAAAVWLLPNLLGRATATPGSRFGNEGRQAHSVLSEGLLRYVFEQLIALLLGDLALVHALLLLNLECAQGVELRPHSHETRRHFHVLKVDALCILLFPQVVQGAFRPSSGLKYEPARELWAAVSSQLGQLSSLRTRRLLRLTGLHF